MYWFCNINFTIYSHNRDIDLLKINFVNYFTIISITLRQLSQLIKLLYDEPKKRNSTPNENG